jgi:hypothetical protein
MIANTKVPVAKLHDSELESLLVLSFLFALELEAEQRFPGAAITATPIYPAAKSGSRSQTATFTIHDSYGTKQMTIVVMRLYMSDATIILIELVWILARL